MLLVTFFFTSFSVPWLASPIVFLLKQSSEHRCILYTCLCFFLHLCLLNRIFMCSFLRILPVLHLLNSLWCFFCTCVLCLFCLCQLCQQISPIMIYRSSCCCLAFFLILWSVLWLYSYNNSILFVWVIIILFLLHSSTYCNNILMSMSSHVTRCHTLCVC